MDPASSNSAISTAMDSVESTFSLRSEQHRQFYQSLHDLPDANLIWRPAINLLVAPMQAKSRVRNGPRTAFYPAHLCICAGGSSCFPELDTALLCLGHAALDHSDAGLLHNCRYRSNEPSSVLDQSCVGANI